MLEHTRNGRTGTDEQHQQREWGHAACVQRDVETEKRFTRFGNVVGVEIPHGRSDHHVAADDGGEARSDQNRAEEQLEEVLHVKNLSCWRGNEPRGTQACVLCPPSWYQHHGSFCPGVP